MRGQGRKEFPEYRVLYFQRRQGQPHRGLFRRNLSAWQVRKTATIKAPARISLTQRMMDPRQPPRALVDFWTSARQDNRRLNLAGNDLRNNFALDVGTENPRSS
jgi:hypothetical protein